MTPIAGHPDFDDVMTKSINQPRTVRNIAALSGGQLVTWSMTLVWTLIVPRLLGPAGMGLIVEAWSVTGILGIVLGLGTRTYLVREMIVDRAEAARLVGTAIMLRLLLAPLFVTAIVVYAHYAHYGSEGTVVLYLAMGATLFTLLSEPMQATFQAIERMEYLAYSDVINKSAQGLLGVVIALVGFGASGITACWLVVSGVVIVVNWCWLRPFLRIELRTSFSRMRRLAHKSSAYWAFGLFFLVYLWIDSVMLSLMTRPEVVGWYGVPTKLFQSLLFVPVIVSTAWLPRLVSAFKESPEHLSLVSRVPIELVLVLSIPLCAATAVAAKPMILFLYGPAYGNAVPVMVILGLCLPFMSLNIMLSQVLIAAKRQVLWTGVMAGATVVNPALNYFFIHFTDHRYRNGAIGASISLLVTEILIVAVGVVVVGRAVVSATSMIRCGRATAASAAMIGAFYAFRPLGTITSFAFAGIIFVVAAFVARLARPDEIIVMRRAATMVAARLPCIGRWRSDSASEVTVVGVDSPDRVEDVGDYVP